MASEVANSRAGRRLARKAGITRLTVRAHVLRHLVATLASAAGADVPTVAATLNHSDIHTVQKYVHRHDAVDEARERVRALLRSDERLELNPGANGNR